MKELNVQLLESESQSIYFFKRKGTTEEPFVDMDESLPVVNRRAVLTEIPDDFQKIRVYGDASETFIETRESLDGQNYHYFVDYRLGVVYFNEAMEGRSLRFVYTGTGIVYYPASRVYTQSENGIPTESLQNVVDDSKAVVEENRNILQNIEQQATTKVSEMETARQDAIQATSDAVIATSNANTATSNANTATQNAITATQEADSATASAVSATNDAITATGLANTATSQANTARDSANQATSEAKVATDYSNTVSSETVAVKNQTATVRDETTAVKNETSALVSQVKSETLMVYKGTVTSASALSNISTKAVGDVYIANDTKAQHRWTGIAWVIVGYTATGGLVVQSSEPTNTGLIFIDTSE